MPAQQARRQLSAGQVVSAWVASGRPPTASSAGTGAAQDDVPVRSRECKCDARHDGCRERLAALGPRRVSWV
jgi:hypothetical protein